MRRCVSSSRTTWQAMLGDRHHQPQILLDELLSGLLLTRSRLLTEIYLLLVREEPLPADLRQVPRERLRSLTCLLLLYCISCHLAPPHRTLRPTGHLLFGPSS